jgi:hypothetical protein
MNIHTLRKHLKERLSYNCNKRNQNSNCLLIYLAETKKVVASTLVAKGVRELKLISTIRSPVFESGTV